MSARETIPAACKTPIRNAKKRTIGYMSIPIIGLLILLLLLGIPALTGLSLFGGQQPKQCCQTGINLSVNSSFYVTVYNSTATYEDQNQSYYVAGMDLILLSIDPLLAKFIAENPTNWSNLMDATNFTTYFDFDIIGVFNSKHFNVSEVGDFWDGTDVFDGTSVKICQEPAFIIAGLSVWVMRGDGEEYEDYFGGFVNDTMFAQNKEFTDYMLANPFMIWNCSQGFINLDIRGFGFNTTLDDYDYMDLTINGVNRRINEEGIFII
jgi:hypothetical protein